MNDQLLEAVNSHMTHVGDLPFIAGVDGTRQAINYIRDLRSALSGDNSSNTITVKWDGAPSIFVGIDPSDGRFFIAKKGIFNKNPKLYKSIGDINEDLSGELKDKFTIAFNELSKLGIKFGVYQGDFMFTQSDLSKEMIDEHEYITFHPNTIVYAVPAESSLARQIQTAKIGIVFHTTYTGNEIETLKAEFGKPITKTFKSIPSVWAVDATVSDLTKQFSLEPKERTLVDSILSQLGKTFRTIDANMLNEIHKDGELLDLVLIYINSLVRAGKKDLPATEKANGFRQFIIDRYNKEIEKRKTAQAKAGLEEKKLRALQYFLKHSVSSIAKIFLLADMIEIAKNILISKMDKIEGLKHFIRTSNGIRVTAPEGFVAISSGGAVKLVDRFEFAAANFSSDVIKGWSK